MKSGFLKLALLAAILCAVVIVATVRWNKLERERDQLELKNTKKADRIDALTTQVAELREHRDRNKRMYLEARDAELKFKQAWLDQEGPQFRSVAGDPSLAKLGGAQKTGVDRLRQSVSELLYSQRDFEGATIIGQDGWLYLKNELHAANAPTSLYEGALEGVRSVHQALANRGVQLVFCPLPTKWELHPEGVDGGDYSGLDLNPQRSAFVQQLRDAGITVADLAPVLRDLDAMYFREDTHWTPEAVAVAAKSVGEVIKSHPAWAAGGSATLTEQHRSGVLEQGDLVNMLGDDRVFAARSEAFEFDEVVDYENRPGRVLVTGRSFTAINPAEATNAGLAPRLSIELSSNVQHAYGGPGTLRKLFRENAPGLSELRFVVWVLPGRDFWESDQQFSANLLTPNMFGKKIEKAAEPVLIEVADEIPELVVAAASPELSASQMIYRDLISAFVVAEADEPSRVYYYHLVKDRKLLLPRFIRKGDRVKVEVVPWEDHIKEHPEFARFTIQDSLSEFDQEIFFVRKWLSDPPSAD